MESKDGLHPLKVDEVIRRDWIQKYPARTGLARVNVYLCIKQALFIRPMNMHCLVAVARCRVQTRRYHCLINHTQSRWQPAPASCWLCCKLAGCRGHGLVPLSEWQTTLLSRGGHHPTSIPANLRVDFFSLVSPSPAATSIMTSS